ncbi:MAG TPA: S8 family serine peptidase [Vicinamibacterales bacterium]|nr:S8 family serine peptidase [Vicinamibacterales bacterium]
MRTPKVTTGGRVVQVLALVCLLVTPAAAQSRPTVVASLTRQVAVAGSARVIVRLRMDPAEGRQLGVSAVARQKLAAIRTRVLERLPVRARTRARTFAFIPYFATTVDAAGLQQLAASADVERVEEDRPRPLQLMDSVPLIGGPAVTAMGYTARGWTVAILDTGVDRTHPFLAGKVVAEACYSSSIGDYTSLCPGGVATSTAPGSAQPCTVTGTCEHGTHVAGIAAGAGVNMTGVAPDASVLAIQVFSYEAATDSLGAFDSDMIAALEHVYDLRQTYHIAAVNLSIGSAEPYDAPCDSVSTAFEAAIEKLRTADIATIVAAGNAGATASLSFPACLSSAISVGSTNKSDVVSGFSNVAASLALFAPGEHILSSVPGGSFAYMSGTSMAAPHVTGAWALVRAADPSAGVSTILAALQDTGVPIPDALAGVTRPRIQVDAAVRSLLSVPAAPEPMAPMGAATSANITPEFDWSPVAGAVWYDLLVDDSTGTRLHQWFSARQAGCASGLDVCRVAPGVSLAPGTAQFHVQANNVLGTGPWSAAAPFSVPRVSSAQILALYGVAGAVQGSAARLWAHVTNAGDLPFPAGTLAWFYVDGPGWSGTHWVGASDVSALTAGSSVWASFDWSVPPLLPPGAYTYTVYVYAGDRISGASPTQSFSVSAAPVPAARVLALYPVNGGRVASAGAASLWAHVQNTGTVPLPAGTSVWFLVDGPSWTGSHWVGGTTAGPLAPGKDAWFLLTWKVPASAAPGTYTYWAQVWATSAISAWSPAQTFVVTR